MVFCRRKERENPPPSRSGSAMSLVFTQIKNRVLTIDPLPKIEPGWVCNQGMETSYNIQGRLVSLLDPLILISTFGFYYIYIYIFVLHII